MILKGPSLLAAVLFALNTAWAAQAPEEIPEPLDKKTLESMITGADAIVKGKVLSVDEPGNGTTEIAVRVRTILKGGTPGREILIVVPGGGRSGAPPVVVPNQPTFTPKETVILFLCDFKDRYRICPSKAGKRPGQGQEASLLEDKIRAFLKRRPIF